MGPLTLDRIKTKRHLRKNNKLSCHGNVLQMQILVKECVHCSSTGLHLIYPKMYVHLSLSVFYLWQLS